MENIEYKKCRFCGNRWKPPEEVNVLHAYCPNCSKARGEEACKVHLSSKDLIIIGQYLISRPQDISTTQERNYIKWHLTRRST